MRFKTDEGEQIKDDKWTWYETRTGENRNEKKSVGNPEGKKSPEDRKILKIYYISSFSEFRLNSCALGSGPVADLVYIVMYPPFHRVRDSSGTDEKLLTSQEELFCLQLFVL